MCFIIHPSCPEPRTAKRKILVRKEFLDIPRHKLVKKEFPDFSNYSSVLISPYMRHKYMPGEQPFVKMIPVNGRINSGYHSYRNNYEGLSYNGLFYAKYIKCYIPKGTKYYYHPVLKEYVSEGLIITEEKSKD